LCFFNDHLRTYETHALKVAVATCVRNVELLASLSAKLLSRLACCKVALFSSTMFLCTVASKAAASLFNPLQICSEQSSLLSASSAPECSVASAKSSELICDRSIPTLLHTSAYVSIRQHTSAYVSIRQHTSAYVSRRSALICESKISTLLPYIYNVSIRQHTSAYVSIRQHTSAYVSSIATLLP